MPDETIRQFEVQVAPKAGAIGRLFGRAPREAAFVEVRNILATTPYIRVKPSDVETALSKARLRCRDAIEELTRIFEHAVLLVAVDGELGDDDRRGLAALQRAFQLTDAEAASATEAALGQVFEKRMREFLADDTFTAQEKTSLEALSGKLGMSDVQTKRLYQAAAEAAVRAVFSDAIADRRYSKDEESRVTALADALDIRMTHDDATESLLERFRLMSRIEQGDLPSIDVPILLQARESCHFSATAGHSEIRTVTKRVNYGGPMASIKVIGGLRWRVGSVSVERVKTDLLTQIDTGILYITSRRVFFDGARKNLSVPLNKVCNFTVYNDGICVEKEAGRDPYFVGAADWELAGACLEAAIRALR